MSSGSQNKDESKIHRRKDDHDYDSSSSSSLSSSRHRVKSSKSSNRKRSSSRSSGKKSSSKKRSKDRDHDKSSIRKHHHRDRKRSRKKYSSSSEGDDSSIEEEESYESSSSDRPERKRSSKKKSSKQHRKRSSKDAKKKKYKKHDSKKEKKDRKKSKRSREDDRESPSYSSSRRRSRNEADDNNVTDRLKRNYDFCNALHDLLHHHPELATELPIMLIRMAGGTSFHLPVGTSVSYKLEGVFQSLASFGVTCDADDNNSWTWKSPDSSSQNASRTANGSAVELVLLKIARFLMDEIGITMDAIQDYEQREKQQQQQQQLEEAAAANKAKDEHDKTIKKGQQFQQEVLDLLETFKQQQKNKDKDDSNAKTTTTPSLAAELAGIVNLILNGECISLDGLPDPKLKLSLEYMFQQAGLEYAEIEDDDDSDSGEDDNDDNNDNDGQDKAGSSKDPTMGYGLPSGENDSEARSNMDIILQTCRDVEMNKLVKGVQPPKQSVAVRGPSLPVGGGTKYGTLNDNVLPVVGDDSESDDDVGPVPVGATRKTGQRRATRGPAMPPELVKAMADRRKREFESVSSGGRAAQVGLDDNVREEWMLEPGEHELLQGIKSGAGALKSRTFKNEKNRGQQLQQQDDVPLDPKIQAELDAIKQAHAESRGPSLLEQHKQKVADEKAAAAAAGDGKMEWKWSRDKNLDEGRRVDTNALNMVMGGASTELKNKFQGTFSRGFM